MTREPKEPGGARDAVTSGLDVLGLLLLAAGLAAVAFPWIGWAALAVAGVIVLAGSQFAAWQSRPAKPVSGPGDGL